MKKKETYDRTAVGKRLRERRKLLGWSRDFTAEQIGLVTKYYADIERGTCGMSVETLLALSRIYGFSLDELIYGKERKKQEVDRSEVLTYFERLPENAQDYCTQILYLFVEGVKNAALDPRELEKTV